MTVLILISSLFCTFLFRGFDFYFDLRNRKFKVNFLIGFKFLFLSVRIFSKQFRLAIRNKDYKFAKSIMNIFVCHYGAVRVASLGFLEEAREMFKCGEVNILQDDPVEYVGKPQKEPSLELITEWMRNSIKQLFQPKMSKELFAV